MNSLVEKANNAEIIDNMNRIMKRYESLFNEWHEIINRELFEGVLQPIAITVEMAFFPPFTRSYAQYRTPKDEKPYICFNYAIIQEQRFKLFIEHERQSEDEDYAWEDDAILLCASNPDDEFKMDLAGGLIHEMIHQYSHENGIKDAEIIDGVDYHTEQFRTLAWEKGLWCIEAENGFSNTHIDPKNPILEKLRFDIPSKDGIDCIDIR